MAESTQPQPKSASVAPEKAKETVRIVGIPISFIVGTFFLVQFLVLGVTASIGFSAIKNHAAQLEEAYQRTGKELTWALGAAANLSYERKDGAEVLSTYFHEAAGRKVGTSKNYSISEIFLLHKDGKILAHSDYAEVSAGKTPEAQVSSRYNTEFFHSAMLLDIGQIYARNFPYPTNDMRKKSNFIIQSLLPEDFEYSTDFATPVTVKGQSVATVHLVKNRIFMYDFLQASLIRYAIMLGIAFAGGILVTGLILLAFSLRWRYVAKLWESMLRYRLENEIMKTRVEHNLDEVRNKVEELEKKNTNQLPPVKKEEPAAMDAILIE